MGVVIGSTSNFYKAQHIYAKAVDKFYREHVQEVQDQLANRTDMACLFDVRYDTPGNLLNN